MTGKDPGSNPPSRLRVELLARLQSGLEPSWMAVADLLRASFGAEQCVVVLQYRPGLHEVLGASGISPELAQRGDERFLAMNPQLAPQSARRGEGEPIVVTADDMGARGDSRRGPFHREGGEGNGSSDGLGALLLDGTSVLGAAVLRRNQAGSRWGPREVDALRGVGDLLTAALMRSRSLRELRVRTAAFEHLASSDHAGFILFDERGEILDSAGTWQRALDTHRDLLASTAHGFHEGAPPAKDMQLQVDGVGSLRLEFRTLQLEGRTRVLCLLRQQAAQRTPTLRIPPTIHFTPRERDILELLVRGMGNAAIARTLGIGVYTAKDHLKAIFRKLAVHTRAEAVALLSGGAPPRDGAEASSTGTE